MHMFISFSWVIWQSFFERYTRLLMETSPEFLIHFLKIYRTTSPMATYWAVNPRRYDVKAYTHYLYDVSSDRCGILFSMPFFSAFATCCFTLITLSGLREIE